MRMEKIRIGILGAADIAYRRFLPALKKAGRFKYVGVAVADYEEWGEGYDEASYEYLLKKKKEKAGRFADSFGGKIYTGYEKLLRSGEIDAVYIPLPPGLHYQWCRKALESGIHVLSEKPCTTNLPDTLALIHLAEKQGLVIYENYAFCMHRQADKIRELIDLDVIGNMRLIRSAFGFPHRNMEDFRYHKRLGGGALLDCGGYVLKAAQMFLQEDVSVQMSVLHQTDNYDVDLYGSAVLTDCACSEAQLAFGMDNSYRCELELWGSRACMLVPRIFTPPADLETQIIIRGQREDVIRMEPDDQFLHAVQFFGDCMEDERKRKRAMEEIASQSRLLEEVREKNILREMHVMRKG